MRPSAAACVPILLAALAGAAPQVLAGGKSLPPPVTFTAEQDHSNMMEQLGIEVLRPGASGDENDPD
ncbi:MAG: acetylxylan esterase, partial [Steroidobacteraceae bacterium]